MVSVIWTEPALTDLEQIYQFIAQDSAERAEAVVRRIRRATHRLATFPLSGRAVPEMTGSPYREIIESGYRILYRQLAEDETVLIAAIYHGRQQLPTLIERT